MKGYKKIGQTAPVIMKNKLDTTIEIIEPIENINEQISQSNAPPGFVLPIYEPITQNNFVKTMLLGNQRHRKNKRFTQPNRFSFEVNTYNIVTERKRNVACANCGGLGHIYKHCNQPIISYGVICFQLHIDTVTNTKMPKYLMVQRKDSLSYVEFIRGKYNIKSKSYIMDMFSMMTNEEREGILQKSFETLWQAMWCKNITDESKTFSKEFKDAQEKFELLKQGYFIKSGDTVHFFDICYILENTKSKHNETEWGFPKGRRNINEGDIACALREFREETGIHHKCIHLCNNYIKPLEEVFSGTNNVRYKHVYYIAKMNLNNHYAQHVSIDLKNKQQCKEIRNICWFEYEEAQSKIREQNVERKELLKRLHSLIMKNVYY